MFQCMIESWKHLYIVYIINCSNRDPLTNDSATKGVWKFNLKYFAPEMLTFISKVLFITNIYIVQTVGSGPILGS